MRRLSLSLALLTAMAAPAAAQVGNQSDITVAPLSATTVLGSFGWAGGSSSTLTSFTVPGTSFGELPSFSATLPMEVVPLATALVSGGASSPAAPNVTISPAVGTLVTQLAASPKGSGTAKSAAAELTTLLRTGTGAPSAALVEALLGAVTGLMLAPSPTATLTAIEAFNASLATMSGEYATNPPPAFLALHALLTGLGAR